jgi:uncharacterized protein YecE (DUF72 family)
MDLLAGTSGYSYKEWLGKFYPEKLAADAMLRFYGERFATVEINNTFYRMPAEDMLTRWATEVPEHFRFTLKAPRRITHEKRLKDVGPDVAELVRRARALGDKFGVLLFQLPPFIKCTLPLLDAFLAAIPDGVRVALEFRESSWQTDEVYTALRAKNVALCVTDNERGDTPLVTTCDWAYLRLRRVHYEDAELAEWAKRIMALPVARAFVYFMHEDDALGAVFATKLLAAAKA